MTLIMIYYSIKTPVSHWKQNIGIQTHNETWLVVACSVRNTVHMPVLLKQAYVMKTIEFLSIN